MKWSQAPIATVTTSDGDAFNDATRIPSLEDFSRSFSQAAGTAAYKILRATDVALVEHGSISICVRSRLVRASGLPECPYFRPDNPKWRTV